MLIERRAGTPVEVERRPAIGNSPSPETRTELLLDGIVHRSAVLFNVPIAVASLRDAPRRVLRASIGLGLPFSPEDLASCANCVTGDEPAFWVDPRSAARFAANAVVTGAPGIRFFAAAPVFGAARQYLGALCVMDRRARAGATAEELEALGKLAEEAASVFAKPLDGQMQMKSERFW